jgi:hypothetical protein
VLAVVVIIGSNFKQGLGASGWNNPAAGWLSTGEKTDLDALRSYLASLGTPDRPVVFVVDNKPPAPFQIYGFSKLTGNTSRYGLPSGQIDHGYLYLGSLGNFALSRPTLIGDPTYDKLSRGFLADTQNGIATSGRRPLVVLDSVFNVTGTNARPTATAKLPTALASNLVEVSHGRVTSSAAPVSSAGSTSSGASGAPLWHVLVVVLGLALLLLPGALSVSWFAPEASFAQMLGLVPALSAASLALIGIVVLAVARSPFSGVLAWLCLGLACLAGAFLRVRSWRSLPRGRYTYGSSLS